MIGRKSELELLRKVYASDQAALVALYGRRRVGKTFLVRNALKKEGRYMEVTGIKNGSMQDQLDIFTEAFQKTFYPSLPIQGAQSWKGAYQLLSTEVRKLASGEKFVLFLDELPWLATPKSGLLQALDHYWNTDWSLIPNLKVVLCGSAASWMLENLIHAKGGLHNRITHRILLQPFTLSETEKFLHSQGVKLNRSQVLELYMSLGGIPYYLNEAQRGLSASQIVSRACFSMSGPLRDEFQRLFPALFSHPEVHLALFKEIVRQRYGISRTELVKKTMLSSGGRLNQRLQELEEAGFIASFIPYGNIKKEIFYRVIDEYCYFYSQWISGAPKGIFAGSSPRYWEQKKGTPRWRAWAGYTFEGICLKHSDRIRTGLGIDVIDCEVGSWRVQARRGSKEGGAQIDLLFDRSDGVITLCEIKYSDSEFVIDKKYASELERKVQIFREKYGTRKEIFLSLITTHGVAKNLHYGRLIHSDLTLDTLFS